MAWLESESVAVFNRNGWLVWSEICSNEITAQDKSAIFFDFVPVKTEEAVLSPE
jgi:hypothetical protein